MSRDLPCLAAHVAAIVLLSHAVLWFFMWRRTAGQLARAKEVIGVLSAPYVHPNARDPFDD